MDLLLMIRNGLATIWGKTKDRLHLRVFWGTILVLLIVYQLIAVYENQSTFYISVLGDSFSSYKGECPKDYRFYYDGERSGVTSVDEMWWSILCKQVSAKPLMIEALSGCTVTEGIRVDSLIAASNIKRCNNLNRGLLQPDLIIIAVGINDYSCDVPIDNFSAAYSKMLQQIKDNYPGAIIVCVSPWFTQRGKWDGEAFRNELGLTIDEYSHIVDRISSEWDCLFFDTDVMGFTKENYYPTYCIDSEECPTHPNAAGQKLIGETLSEWMINNRLLMTDD